MTDALAVAHARELFQKKAWGESYRLLEAADRKTPLEPEDLERLATVAYLIGHDDVSIQVRTRAHAAYLEAGDRAGAARAAFWIGFALLERPSHRAQATGWLARAQRLVEELKEPCVEQGWLFCAEGRLRAGAGEFDVAHARFVEADAIGSRFNDRDLVTLARNGQGRTRLMMNDAAGLALLDEAMVSVAAGETDPVVSGAVYCSVITACRDIFDLRRAHEWTTALQGWCESQPDVVPFRGYCLIRRSELMQLHGAWDDALGEAERACERLTDRPEAGAAYYQLAEIHRVRGEFAKAEDCYRSASQAGRKPQPGFALLRLNQGQPEAADKSIRLAMQETRDTHTRVLVFFAAVEILLARGDVAAAREAGHELSLYAKKLDLPYLKALAAHAAGAVALADDQPAAALESLRAACSGWQDLDVPFEQAECRVLIGQAYRQLGDLDGAQLEWDAASEAFDRLGAKPAAALVSQLTKHPATQPSTSLTGREIEVLRLIATGITNSAIAGRLGISERTVDRHVSNIFTKLDLSSRAGATAYAYEHKLI